MVVPVVDELLGCELIDPVLGVAALPLELVLWSLVAFDGGVEGVALELPVWSVADELLLIAPVVLWLVPLELVALWLWF